MKLQSCIFYSLLVFFLCFWAERVGAESVSPAGASSASSDNLDRNYDWVFYVDIAAMPHFLNTRDCQIQNVERFVVSFQQTAASALLRGTTPPQFRKLKYEEFWYHAGRPFALNTLWELPIPAHEQGAIWFRISSGDGSPCPLGIADCLLRLLIDARVNKAIIAAVMIPDAQFSSVASALQSFNFSKVSGNSGANTKTTLRLISYPGGEEVLLYFGS
jgi:hypothetical protein